MHVRAYGGNLMTDLNNRPGGPNLIVTAKTAHQVHFLDAATLTMRATIDMPGSTHELALSADSCSVYGTVYGDGVFAKRVNPDRRIVVIDLPSKSLSRVIDLGAVYAPHGVMMDQRGTLWSSGELGNAVLAIDPASGKVERIDVGDTAHWVAVSHTNGKVFASVKSDYLVTIDAVRRAVIDRIALPHVVEGIAVTPDGAAVYACAQDAAELYVVDARTHALARTVPIDGADPRKKQMRRVRVSPDNAYVVVSSNQDHRVAIYQAEGLEQIATIATKRSPMGFGFAPGGKLAYLCCHDDAEVLEFELATGRVTRAFSTAPGCEFIVAYE
jgi:DNA-binding beta-propeller fold protein YncE